MGFLIKSVLILLTIVVIGGFAINQVPSWKQRVIEIVNPATKEARLLGELKENLDELDTSLSSTSGTDLKNKSDLIAKSKSLVEEITTVNQKKSGIIQQSIGKIIDAFIDKTPYPADHLKTSTSSLPPPICPPTN